MNRINVEKTHQKEERIFGRSRFHDSNWLKAIFCEQNETKNNVLPMTIKLGIKFKCHFIQKKNMPQTNV